MADSCDKIDIAGVAQSDTSGKATPDVDPARKFLSLHFQCCHVYGRLYRNEQASAYEGRCPACAAAVRVGIGPEGSGRRIFQATRV